MLFMRKMAPGSRGRTRGLVRQAVTLVTTPHILAGSLSQQATVVKVVSPSSYQYEITQYLALILWVLVLSLDDNSEES